MWINAYVLLIFGMNIMNEKKYNGFW